MSPEEASKSRAEGAEPEASVAPEPATQPPSSVQVEAPLPLKKRRSLSRWGRDIVKYLIAAVIGACINQSCRYACPPGQPTVEWPSTAPDVRVSVPAKKMEWAVRARVLTKEEQDGLAVLRRKPPKATAVFIYVRNPGPQQVQGVTFLLESTKPFIAHFLPLGVNVTDEQGRAITDPFRHFAYEREAKFTYHDIPVGLALKVKFLCEEGSGYNVICYIDDKVIPTSEWPADVSIDESALPFTPPKEKTGAP